MRAAGDWRCQRKPDSHPVPYTNSMEQKAGWETDNSSVDTESFLLWNMCKGVRQRIVTLARLISSKPYA